MTWGVNFGQNNLTAAVLEAQSILSAFDSPVVARAGIVLDLLEIGNEADLYPNHGARDRELWNVTEYIKESAFFLVPPFLAILTTFPSQMDRFCHKYI